MPIAIDGLKVCALCSETKPVSAFAKRTCAKDGLYAYCRPCGSQKQKINREHLKKNPIRRIIPPEKRCTICRETKSADQFYRNSRCRDGLDGYCIPCMKTRVVRNIKIRQTSAPALPADGMKVCNRCKESKPLIRFHVSRSYSDHRHAMCRECVRIVARPRNLRKMYGLTPEEYQAMHDSQDGKCAICKQPETHMRNGRVIFLCVDHDHTTGKIRGLLCRACNNAIGMFQDNPTTLLAAADYLLHHSDIS